MQKIGDSIFGFSGLHAYFKSFRSLIKVMNSSIEPLLLVKPLITHLMAFVTLDFDTHGCDHQG
jgi:hypothetical protein